MSWLNVYIILCIDKVRQTTGAKVLKVVCKKQTEAYGAARLATQDQPRMWGADIACLCILQGPWRFLGRGFEARPQKQFILGPGRPYAGIYGSYEVRRCKGVS